MQAYSFQEIQGTRLWVKQLTIEETRSQSTLIFLHEGLGSIEMWKDFPEQLCESIGMNGLLYDRQGHGRSDALSGSRKVDYLHREAWEVLPELIRDLKIESPIFVGHSDGGTIALLYAARYAHTRAILTEAAHVKVESITLEGIRSAVRAFEQPQRRSLLARYHLDKTDALLHAWADIWLSDAFGSWNIEDELKKISCPTLIIQGEEDPYASQDHLWDIASGIGPSAQAFLAPKCGHIPHHQAREVVLDKMEAFLRRLDIRD
ncbi:MAG: alpha/beta hydrolase [Bacteroidota bacterium]